MLAFLLLSLFTIVRASSRAVVSSQNSSTIAAAWYTGWHAVDFPLSQVSWSKYTHLIYAFATTTPDITTLGLVDTDLKLLPQFVSAAQQNNVIPMLSIGGFTGSRWFSSHVRTATNRTRFVKTLTDLVQQYHLDGLDFDWEFPGTTGIGCNEKDPNDTVNFLSFLQELRNTTVGRNLIIAAATWTSPWVDATGLPSRDLAAFAPLLDFIAIMNYDVKSNSSIGAGPTSPLDDACAPQGAHLGSAKSAVAAWVSAGIPATKIVLGVPSYGQSFVLSSQNTTDSVPTYPSYSLQKRRGDRWDSDGGVDVCGTRVGPGGTYEYWGLIEAGLLNPDGSPRNGIKYRFDDCSKTPFLYNTTTQLYISYDNALSFAYKGGYIHSAGLRGFALWEAGGDYKDTLLNSILNATRNGGPVSEPSSTPSASSRPTSDAPSLWPSTLLPLSLVVLTWLILFP